ncbi:hypothetical protein [Haloarcula amylolytica]|uniref:hypothetical protein n=1 Tax=Haloarcula amylolytica TaxID=396317 RepID=UPI0013757DC8|nr:hypothetical protein [Haloarcula amylolytica]
MDVQDVECISRETALDRTCPECGSIDWFPALVRDDDGGFRLGAHCDDCLYSEVL